MISDDRLCPPLPPQNLRGKEGVDGSSPSEGLHKSPANRPTVLSAMAKNGRFAGTRRVHFRTGGHSRHARHCLEHARDAPRPTNSKSSCKQAIDVARAGATLTSPFAREGVKLLHGPFTGIGANWHPHAGEQSAT